jgi:hypothetical protein
VLDAKGNAAAPAISELVRQSDAESDPAAWQAIQADLQRYGPRLNRAARIALYRRHGLAEPDILALLVHEQRRLMPSRKGPRTIDEAILRAARQLLAAPPGRITPAAHNAPRR